MTLYTGIGSRRTPPEVLQEMESMAAYLRESGYMLRSGAAPGADSAFERGAAGQAVIYLPWAGFEGRRGDGFVAGPTAEAYVLAAQYHPAWARLSRGARALMARNCHQVLGLDLQTPSSFVVCWTPDGCETPAQRTRDTGGTGLAIALAFAHGIPVINLANRGGRSRLQRLG